MAGRHRGVRGKDEAGRGENTGFGEAEMLRFHEGADAFKGEKSGMAFVHMIDGGAEAESLQSADAADAEKDFLADAHIQIAAVELRGDGAMVGAIGGDIRIEKIELNAANDGTPDASGDFTIGKGDVDLHVGNELDG